jgi:hypothetical protein
MATKPADWTDTEDAGEEVAAPATVAAPAATASQSPAPAATPVKQPVAAPVAEKFSDNLGECFDLLATLQPFARLADKPSKEAVAGQTRLIALRKHIHEKQQGLPKIHVDATHKGAFAGLRVSDRSKWTILARQNPDVKKLLAAHDALAAELEKLKKK